jgi:hypothetical protein
MDPVAQATAAEMIAQYDFIPIFVRNVTEFRDAGRRYPC